MGISWTRVDVNYAEPSVERVPTSIHVYSVMMDSTEVRTYLEEQVTVNRVIRIALHERTYPLIIANHVNQESN